MSFYSNEDFRARYDPFLYLAGYPLYLVQVLVLFQVAAMLVTTFSGGLGFGEAYGTYLAYSSDDVLQAGRFWQLVTYPLVEPPSLWFAIVALMTFFTFGPDVEKYVGRPAFLKLYAALLLVPSVLLTFFGLFTPFVIHGSSLIFFGIFIGFCTLYPNAVFCFFFVEMKFKWAAWILLAMATFGAFYARNPMMILPLWISAGVGHYGLRMMGVGGGLAWVEWLENRLAEREAKRRHLRVVRQQEKERTIDEILEKISREGIGSLTREERIALEKARTELIRRDGGK
jgi:membrane associated rhomboid family serine protease